MKLLLEYIFNSILALVLLVLLLPILGVIYWLIRQSGNKPIFTQDRVGHNGKIFKIYKFQTMLPNANDGQPFICDSYDDSRITPLGKTLRRKKFDELPQLLNIILGDMNFVGPRPEIPYYHQKNLAEVPRWVERLAVKPGITGYAQIHPRISHNPHEKIIEDLRYISERSFLVDLRVIFNTFMAWIQKKKL